MARKVVTYDAKDFKGGDYGSIGAWAAPPGTFSATNMFVTRLGELCVRPGLYKQNPSGLANGIVHGFGMTPWGDNDVWFVQGTAVRTFSLTAGNNLKTSATALAEVPTAPLAYDMDGLVIYIASLTDKIYKLVPATGATLPAVTPLVGSPGAGAICVYGDRLIVGRIDGSNGNRLVYNGNTADISDHTVWNPSEDFIDVGDSFGIAGLHAQRQHLAILKPRSFHVLTGVPGVNPVLRQVAEINGPTENLHSAMMFPHQIIFGGLGTTYPSTFDGSRVDQKAYLEKLTTFDQFSGTFPPVHGIGVTRGKDNCVTMWDGTNNSALTNRGGIWTYHTFGVDVSGYTVPVMPTDNIIAMCDGGAAGATPNFYIWNVTADSPGLESGGQFMRAGDDSSTALSATVTFPEWHSEDGAEVYVRNVIVDFRTWNTGAANTNHFDLHVESKNLYNVVSTVASNTVSFDSAQASSSTSGTERREIFGFGEQGMGNGFQLHFTNLRGVAIKRVTVVLDNRPVRV